MICKEVGCDLSYCQHLVHKPKTAHQQITDCTPQFNAFRECIIREKKMFRSFMHGQDMSDPMAIPNYLENHFKEKALRRKQDQMMGGQEEELKSKIEEMEEVNTAGRKLINV